MIGDLSFRTFEEFVFRGANLHLCQVQPGKRQPDVRFDTDIDSGTGLDFTYQLSDQFLLYRRDVQGENQARRYQESGRKPPGQKVEYQGARPLRSLRTFKPVQQGVSPVGLFTSCGALWKKGRNKSTGKVLACRRPMDGTIQTMLRTNFGNSVVLHLLFQPPRQVREGIGDEQVEGSKGQVCLESLVGRCIDHLRGLGQFPDRNHR